MRVWTLPLGILLAVTAILWLSGRADAATCTDDATNNDQCSGHARVQVTSAPVDAQQRACLVTTDQTGGDCLGPDVYDATPWELDAGASVTFQFFHSETGVTGLAPNKVTIQVRYDDTATVARDYQTLGALPTQGTTYTFHSTNTGDAGGAERAGTYRLYVRIVKDDAPGGVGNYDADSDGALTLGVSSIWNPGYLRGNLKLADCARNAYPAGATFAYGIAADEQATLTATGTARFADNNQETTRTKTERNAGSTVVETGVTIEFNGGSIAQSYTIDLTYDAVSASYNCLFEIVGNAALTTLSWTVAATTGHGAGITVASPTLFRKANEFTADPRIRQATTGAQSFASADLKALMKIGSVAGATVTVFNRGETAYWETFLYNARGEKLSRAMTWRTEDTVATVCTSLGSVTPIADKYSGTFTIPTGGTCLVAGTSTGADRRFRATNTDQDALGARSYGASTLYFVDAHTQNDPVLDKDDFPTQDADEDFTYILGADTVQAWCHVKSVRLDAEIDTNAASISWAYHEPDLSVADSGTSDTGADGWTPNGAPFDLVAVPPTGIWDFQCAATFDANTGTDTEQFNVISAFTGNLENQFFAPNVAPVSYPINIFVRTTRDAACFIPDAAPRINITRIDETQTPPSVLSVLSQSMLNAVTDDTSVNGCLYYVVWVPVLADDYNVHVRANYTGAQVDDSMTLQVSNEQPLLRLVASSPPTEAVQVTLFVHVEFLDLAYEPTAVPQIRIHTITPAPAWTEDTPTTDTNNVVDWTPTVDGALYALNWTPPQQGPYHVQAKLAFLGHTLRDDESYNVLDSGVVTQAQMGTVAHSIDAFVWLLMLAASVLVPLIHRNTALAGLGGILATLSAFFALQAWGGFHQVLAAGASVAALAWCLSRAWDARTLDGEAPGDRVRRLREEQLRKM